MNAKSRGKQAAFLQAMLTSRTKKEACEKAGISRTTANKYLEDPDFKEALSEARRESVGETANYMRAALTECVDRLLTIIRDEDVSPAIHVQAVNAMFANYRPLVDEIELTERMEALQQKQEEQEAQIAFLTGRGGL